MEKVHLLIVIVSPIPTLARHARQAPWAAHGRPPARLLSWPSTLSHAHQSPVVAASHVREGKRVLGTYLASPLMTSRACVCVCVCVCCRLLCALPPDVAQPPSSRRGPPDSPALVQQHHVRSGWLSVSCSRSILAGVAAAAASHGEDAHPRSLSVPAPPLLPARRRRPRCARPGCI